MTRDLTYDSKLNFCFFLGERPYKCHLPDCGRAFIQLSNLQQHLRNHDAQVERAKNRPFHCNICGKGFATESSLRTHTSKVSHVRRTQVFLLFAFFAVLHDLIISILIAFRAVNWYKDFFCLSEVRFETIVFQFNRISKAIYTSQLFPLIYIFITDYG